MSIKCEWCGLPTTDRFCSDACKTQMICPDCGHTKHINSLSCKTCGTAVIKSDLALIKALRVRIRELKLIHGLV